MTSEEDGVIVAAALRTGRLGGGGGGGVKGGWGVPSNEGLGVWAWLQHQCEAVQLPAADGHLGKVFLMVQAEVW